jgi:hypothetical protein
MENQKPTLTYLFIILFGIFAAPLFAQYEYQASAEHPFGLPNPDAPQQIKDYEGLIGICDCTSTSRNPDQTWADPVAMTWKWSYIMNGMGVMDETLKADGGHSGSIRQYNQDSSRWQVHYFSTTAPVPVLPVWTGGKVGENIVLYKDHTAPGGQEGHFRLTFSEISEKGYNWVGEWVDLTETIVFPTWKIECRRELKD